MTFEIPLFMVLVLPVAWVTFYLMWRKGAPGVARWKAVLFSTFGTLIYVAFCAVFVVARALIST